MGNVCRVGRRNWVRKYYAVYNEPDRDRKWVRSDKAQTILEKAHNSLTACGHSNTTTINYNKIHYTRFDFIENPAMQ
jgi:hypothetical protein